MHLIGRQYVDPVEKQPHTNSPLRLWIIVAVSAPLMALLVACEQPTIDETIVFSVTNRSNVPLRNVTIDGQAVGDFADGFLTDIDSIDDIELPSEGEYAVSAEVDSAAGTVRSFSYTRTVSDGTRVYLRLPSDYIAIYVTPGNVSLNADRRFSYGSVDFGFKAEGTTEFLGVYDRVEGQAGLIELFLDGSKQSEVDLQSTPEAYGHLLDFPS